MTTGGGLIDAIMTSPMGGDEKGIVDVLFDVKKARLPMITEIPPELVYPLTVMTLVAGRYRSKVLAEFLSTLYQLQISRDRKGRAEMIEALLASRTQAEELT